MWNSSKLEMKLEMWHSSTVFLMYESVIFCMNLFSNPPSLHPCSVREMCGTEDVDIAYLHFKAFFEDFCSLEAQLDFDKPQ